MQTAPTTVGAGAGRLLGGGRWSEQGLWLTACMLGLGSCSGMTLSGTHVAAVLPWRDRCGCVGRSSALSTHLPAHLRHLSIPQLQITERSVHLGTPAPLWTLGSPGRVGRLTLTAVMETRCFVTCDCDKQ